MATTPNLTRNGICYDLKNSPYELDFVYEDYYILYRFSSIMNRNKFVAAIQDNRNKINDSLSNRFKFNIKNDILCDLALYTKVEKRGFYVRMEDEEITCQENLELIGQRVVRKN